MALGGYIYFDALGWKGIPFVLAIVFLAMLAIFLVRTLVVSPKLMQLEVTKQEAVIPVALRKQLLVVTVLSVLAMGAFLVLLAMMFS
jgi:hypothetical protein